MNKLKSLLLGSILVISMSACDKDDNKPVVNPTDPTEGRQFFNVVVTTSTEGNTETYVQAFTDLSKGEITVNGTGFELKSTRSARVYASNNGTTLYNLDYGGGTISNYDVFGSDTYVRLKELNFQPIIGDEYARWTKINEESALIHNVDYNLKTSLVADDKGNYLYHDATAIILNVDLVNFAFKLNAENKATSFKIPRTEYDNKEKIYVGRIDAPAIVGGKAYYGLFKSKYDTSTGKNTSGFNDYPSTSLVVDYPSLKNPKMISSTIGTGQNYGYRIPVAYTIDNDIYQLSSSPAHILKISGATSDYDNTYDFDLAEALGVPTGVGARGWFYTGNGIGYVLYYDEEKGNSEKAAAWGVARVDIINKTAIKMNVPDGLYLFQYQYAVTGNDGKLHMALAPVGEEGNIYIFDPTNATADGFTVGAKLKTGAGISYVGIF